MDVLHIDTGREMRGGQHQVLLLLRALGDAGHGSTLLARPNSPLLSAAKEQGISVAPVTLLQIWERSSAFEIVHAHDGRAHTLAALASRRKFVVARRVAFPPNTGMASRWKYGKAAGYLAVSHVVASLLAKVVPQCKIDVVYDAVEDLAPVEWSPDNPAVALASHDPLKGRDLVERAASLSGVPVVFSSDLPKDLQRASLFAYISRSEGLGSAALLAMQMGVPVVASRVGGLPEVVEDGVSGILVENNARAIASAMLRVREDSQFARMLVRAARATVKQRFGLPSLLEATVASYKRALAS